MEQNKEEKRSEEVEISDNEDERNYNEEQKIDQEEEIQGAEDKNAEDNKIFDRLGNPLFEMKGATKKMHWHYVRLVARKGSNMKKVTSKDAIKAFCLLCQTDISYTKGNGNSVYRHVENNHKRKLNDLLENSKCEDESRKKQKPIQTFFSNMMKEQDMKMASKEDQLHGEALIVQWISENLRPFIIVEDKAFVELCKFLCCLRGQFKVPSRTKTRNQMMALSGYVMNLVKKNLRIEMDYFSLTTDIWSSRVMQSFMALTLHYLTESFELKTYVLEVKPLIGSHTGEFIASCLIESMNCFGLQRSKLALLLRDNASNGVKACKDMNINHFGCIGHGLHLVVCPFLIEKKSRLTVVDDETNDDENTGDDIDDDIAEYQNDDDDQPADAVVAEACKIVSKFRNVVRYIKNSPKAKEKVMQFGGLNIIDNRDTFTLRLDVRTRWNSVLDMLLSMLKLKAPLGTFLLHLTTAEGKKEFNQKKLPQITETEWVFIEGLCNILNPFKNATCLLSGESYPTFIQAMPTLRKLKKFLIDASEGTLLSTSSTCKPIAEYIKQYHHDEYFDEVVCKLKACCSVLLEQFLQRFVGLNIDILWVTFLDPRNRKMKHLKADEYKKAKAKFVDVVTALSMPLTTSQSEHTTEDEEAFDPYLGNLFDSPSKIVCDDNVATNDVLQEDHVTVHRSAVNREVENYLDPQLIIPSNTDPVVWWRYNKIHYPKIAVAARKWLCVPASSTASERVFSHCGVALSAKQASMRGDALMNQVLLKNNLKHMNMNMEDIKKALLSSKK